MHAIVKIELGGRKGAGVFAFIDYDDYERVAKYKWRVHTAPRSLTRYARGKVDGVDTLLHRFIIGAEAGSIVDHIDGDGLNCRKENLRFLTQAENIMFGKARRAFDEWESQL